VFAECCCVDETGGYSPLCACMELHLLNAAEYNIENSSHAAAAPT